MNSDIRLQQALFFLRIREGLKMARKLFIYIFILLLPLLVYAEEGTWITGKNSQIKRSEVAVVSLNEKIYVIGGLKRFCLK